MPTFTPARGHYLVRREAHAGTTKSGLIIPASAERHKTAIVLSAGPGNLTANGILIEPSYKPMDRVLYYPHSGTEFDSNGEALLIIQEKEILLKIEEDKSAAAPLQRLK